MSLMHPRQLCSANSFDYLIELQADLSRDVLGRTEEANRQFEITRSLRAEKKSDEQRLFQERACES
jgi:hypothetical protein